MWRLADRQLDEFVADGHCEFISAYSQPFAMLVVADLLGVPESDHQRFREGFGLSADRPASSGSTRSGEELNALNWLDDWFATYIEDRRREPRRRRPDRPGARQVSRRVDARRHRGRADGDVPVRRRSGDDRSAPRHRAEVPRRVPGAPGRAAGAPRADPGLHRRGAADREPGQGRLPPRPPGHDRRRGRHRTGNAGDAAQRRGQPRSATVRVPGRVPPRPPNAKEHIAFGRGHHACPGGPLARAEGRISLERILDRMRDIRLSEEHHGPAGARRFDYEPTWVLRGLSELHIEFTPVDA